jgi:hypothetical protein
VENVPHLESIDGAEVSLFAMPEAELSEKLDRAVAVPYVDIFFLEEVGIR